MAENLKCSICEQDATVHLTQIVNNKIHKVDLCESCAQKKGVTDEQGFSLADLLSKASLSPVPDEDQHSCPSCGYKTTDFHRLGRLGCAECYHVFESQIVPVLEDMHAGLSHKGKVPKVLIKRRSFKYELITLKESLSRAVAEEAYEEAAKFRDKIRELQAEVENENLEGVSQ